MELNNETWGRPFFIADMRVDPALNTINLGDHAVQVEPQVMHVLLCLAQNANEVVTREDLLREVWKDSFPNDEGLSQAIWKIRAALGDSAKESRFIQTVRKRGYRLIAPVHAQKGVVPMSNLRLRPERRRYNNNLKWAAVVLLCCSAFAIGYLQDPTLEPIEERQWLLTDRQDTLKMTVRALSSLPGKEIPENMLDSLALEAIQAFEARHALADSLGPDTRVQKQSIRRRIAH